MPDLDLPTFQGRPRGQSSISLAPGSDGAPFSSSFLFLSSDLLFARPCAAPPLASPRSTPPLPSSSTPPSAPLLALLTSLSSFFTDSHFILVLIKCRRISWTRLCWRRIAPWPSWRSRSLSSALPRLANRRSGPLSSSTPATTCPLKPAKL